MKEEEKEIEFLMCKVDSMIMRQTKMAKEEMVKLKDELSKKDVEMEKLRKISDQKDFEVNNFNSS